MAFTLAFGLSAAYIRPAEAASAPKGPNGSYFYNPPQSLHPGKHGEAIWATRIESGVPNSKAWKLLYWSTTVDNQTVPVSALVIAPMGAGPPQGRPVISWGHGTSGVPRNCAPSMVDNPARDALFYFQPDSPAEYDFGIPALTLMIAAGYVVVATDYNGLGAPGIHHYLIGPTEGRNLLDAAVAVREIPEADAGAQVVAIGWSQGGQAAVWAAQLADYLAPPTKVIGAIALAPVNAVEQLNAFKRMVASGQKLKPMSAVERSMGWYAMTVAYPELKLFDVMTPAGVEFFDQAFKAGECNHHMGDTYAYTEALRGPLAREEPANPSAWLARYEQSSLGMMPAKAPLAVYQGDDDTAVAPAATEAYVKTACESGATIAYTHYPATDHIRLSGKAAPDFLPWIADRFAGKLAPTTCR